LQVDEPILDAYFDMHAFFGKSYGSCVEKIFEKDKNDSDSPSPPIKEYITE
jgi:hypothetical protein